jgi:hypothetical protein
MHLRTLTLIVLPATLAAMGSPFNWIEDADRGTLTLKEAGQPVLTYNFGDQLPAGVDPRYTRSCYVHPIHGLDGEILTDDFPADHYHHRGLSWMWPTLQIGDEPRTYDLWHIRGLRQYFDSWIDRRTDADRATLATRHHWKIGDRVVAHETLRLVIHRPDNVGRAIDVELQVRALDQAVHLRGEVDKGYGAFCLRYAPREQTRITTDRGPLTQDSLHQTYAWTDLSARFAQREDLSGIAVFTHSRSHDRDASWILRHYGFIGTCWPGTNSFTLPPGEAFTLRHRLYLHRGNSTEGRVQAAFEQYRESQTVAP